MMWARPETATTPEHSMTTTYRVEAHDGRSWSFGININPNTRLPQFCHLDNALISSLSEARILKADAARICGGTLRVRKVA